MRLLFRPWKRFRAYHNKANVRSFLKDAAQSTEDTLRKGILSPPKTGVRYGKHQASAPGEYPANETGTLQSGIRQRIGTNEVEVGTTDMHGFFLRMGTTKMRPRKMSDAALREALPGVRARMKAFAEWCRTK